MKTHELKTWPLQFQAVLDGRKRFELRQDDRGFTDGDELLLREWNPQGGTYTGRETRVRVTYLLVGGPFSFGLPAGMSVMSVEPVAIPSAESRLAEITRALRGMLGAYEALIDAQGLDHEDGCPEDDTCDCPLAVKCREAEAAARALLYSGAGEGR